MEQVCRRKRDRSNAENELKYKQNKRILNEGLQSLSLSQYTTITDALVDDNDDILHIDDNASVNELDIGRCYDTDDEGQQLQPLEDEEHLISVLKGGQIKYLRKVDFLVDELIRKSHRTEVSKQYCPKDFDSGLPSTLGPSPTTDHALSKSLWPVKIFDSVHYLDDESIVIHPHRLATARPRNGSNAILLHDLAGGLYSMGTAGTVSSGNGSSNGNNSPKMDRDIFDLSDDLSDEDEEVGNTSFSAAHLAGDTTHSDWGIVDVEPSFETSQHGSPTQLSTAAVAEHNGHNNINNNSNNHFTEYRQKNSTANQRTRLQCLDSDDDDDEDDVMVSVWNNGDGSSVAGSCASTHSNLSTLSNESSPRVPYYIDADDNVYYMLDNPDINAGGGGEKTATSTRTRDTKGSTIRAAVDSSAQIRGGKSSASPRPQHFHLVDEEEEAARFLGVRRTVNALPPVEDVGAVEVEEEEDECAMDSSNRSERMEETPQER